MLAPHSLPLRTPPLASESAETSRVQLFKTPVIAVAPESLIAWPRVMARAFALLSLASGSALAFRAPGPVASSVMRGLVVQRRSFVVANTVENLSQEVHLLKTELTRKDAIIQGLLDTLSKTAITTTGKGYDISSTPLKDLCELTKEACDAVQPMLANFYEKIAEDRHGGVSKLKSDATYFTIADGVVQHLFIEHFLAGDKFAQIVGEEDESFVNIKTKPYMVDELVIPDEFVAVIDAARIKVDQLGTRLDAKAYKSITVFVDPIDGTREFATAQGEYVTMLVGYNDAIGNPIAGVMYRPLTSPCTWAAGAKTEEYTASVLDMANPPHPKGMLITDAAVSPFIRDLIEECGMERIPSVASGNRAMMLLEGKEEDSLVPYTHLKAKKNLDFIPGTVQLTLSNAKNKKSFVKGETFVVNDVAVIKEYSCVQGLFAVDKAAMGDVKRFREAMLKVKKVDPPTFT
ncbi:hypothetical protein T492DRAFT_1050351 [Pavlovales sp. CCMP2436]|nr:hypothetical protein T492DRAFT_1050351 [Pavlovales sp. CCMP2436]